MRKVLKPILSRQTGRVSSWNGILSPKLQMAFFSSSRIACFQSKDLIIEKSTVKKPKVAKEKLIFGKTTTDHMLTVNWSRTDGWKAPQIRPYGPLGIDPASSVYHYAIECFEGMKAYLDKQGKIRLFRPEKNMERFNSSCKRVALPAFPGDQLLASIKELLKIEKEWIPEGRGYSMYIRPTAIGTEPSLGVGPSHHSMIFVLLSPVGPYYPEGFKPVKLLADEKYVRAWPGGTGAFKVGLNYGSTIAPQLEAVSRGFTQILWLFKDQVTEVGTMNLFVHWINEKGKEELNTPPLDGTILPGVTRDSILQIAKDKLKINVAERSFTIHELIKALQEGRVKEVFGAGTAAIVAPVKSISYVGKDYSVPLDPSNPDAGAGPLAAKLAQIILDIQYGENSHGFDNWSVVV
eukprot:TRINITY_DN5248_c0_g1_i1.p1 TRINITY_DN5248_c0_g1~~TRINITY_DN5248_c0_g1_i1.p1  ORF type:complete len:406 (+),score=49.98 TRINITY_DN5248_c0_g1_i1:41-1258(+)